MPFAKFFIHTIISVKSGGQYIAMEGRVPGGRDAQELLGDRSSFSELLAFVAPLIATYKNIALGHASKPHMRYLLKLVDPGENFDELASVEMVGSAASENALDLTVFQKHVDEVLPIFRRRDQHS